MIEFTAKQLHDNPSEVYRAAVKGPVKITHKHHGSFKITACSDPEQPSDTYERVNELTGDGVRIERIKNES